MKSANHRILQHACICEWDCQDTETILKDLVVSKKFGLPAISIACNMLPVANSLSDGDIKIFAFIDGTDSENEFYARKNVIAQKFLNISKKPILAYPDIFAFSLKDTEHTDLEQIAASGGAGFMMIDESGKFMHRFYDFLELLPERFDGALQYCAGTNDPQKLENALRLVEMARPELFQNFRIFVTCNFFTNLDNAAINI